MGEDVVQRVRDEVLDGVPDGERPRLRIGHLRDTRFHLRCI